VLIDEHNVATTSAQGSTPPQLQQSVEMASGGFTAIKAALFAFIGLAFLAWILQLIGLAGLQRECYDMATLGRGGGLSTGGETISPLASNLALTGIRGA
jgi:hypothetical protein